MLLIITVTAAALLLVVAGILFIRQDRLRASMDNQKVFMRAAVEKARRDRTHLVRIPAETVVNAFGLDTVALPDPRKFAGKSPGHPATLPAPRRKKL